MKWAGMLWRNRGADELGNAIAPGQQDPQPPRGRRLQVELRRRWQEAQGQEHRTFASAPLPRAHLNANDATQVNADIVGGLVVEVGDRTIDLSVSSKLAKMNKLLTDTL
jgi:hypothetical protein